MTIDTLLLLGNAGADFSIGGMWEQMGLFAKVVLVFLILQFILAVAMGIERMNYYAKAKRESVSFIMLLRNFLAERKLEEAVAAVQQHPNSPVAKIVGAGLREYLQGVEALHEQGPDDVGDFDVVDAVNRQMERTKEREGASLNRGLVVIATTGTTAPFIGLLGTVVGIITAFQGLKDASGGLSAVAGGISEALFATAVGLLVAIPAVMAYNAFNAKVDSFKIDMNDVASELIDFVLKEGRY